MISYSPTPVHEIKSPVLSQAGVTLFIKREDLNHPFVSGNKWWKLKYNLAAAIDSGADTLLTFGGAYSNHIFATAAAAKEAGLQSIGIIRGEETNPLNSTLAFAEENGMRLHYISREEFRSKAERFFIEMLKEKFGSFYLIPEGGTNQHALSGCFELGMMLDELPFDYLCLPVGTGGTIAGIATAVDPAKAIIGFSVLKGGNFLDAHVSKLMNEFKKGAFSNWRIETEYHFGGYAKTNQVLDDFIKSFRDEHQIPLEHVYTGKMMFGIFELVKGGRFKRGTRLLALHTGGLQNRSC